jgi:hypothetical protein
VRAALRPLRERKLARERARRAVLREVLLRSPAGVSEASLQTAWKQATGAEPAPAELSREVAALGGDVDLARPDARPGAGDVGQIFYRFPDFEAEAKALAAEREAAAEAEAKLGEVVFTSES